MIGDTLDYDFRGDPLKELRIMRTRLKTAQEERRELEIELLHLKKSYLKVK